jgi:hypothetical protein
MSSYNPWNDAILNPALGGSGGVPFTGDSGAGGVQGLVPAPAAGDGAAGKVLGATGGWVAGGTGGGLTNLDGGSPSSVYGGVTSPIDGGTP